MFTRVMFHLGLLAMAVLFLPSPVAAQVACEDCGEISRTCLPAPGEQVYCIEWDIMGHTDCEGAAADWCGPSQALDVTGLPAPASRVAAAVPETATWLRRSCDATVLRFSFNREDVTRMDRETEFITL